MTCVLWVCVCLMLLGCSVYGDDDRIYSSYECHTVEGADPTDLNARSCVLHNVCIDRIEEGHAVWSYFVDPSKPDDVPLLQKNIESGEIASMGYRKGLNMRVEVKRERKYSPKNIVDPSRVTVAFCVPSNNYAHFVLDGMFGLHWQLVNGGYADKETGALPSRSNIDILDVCRQSKQEKNLRGLFSDTTPSLALDYVGSCYSNLLVGPAGHYALHGFKTSDPVFATAQDFDRFRYFFIDHYKKIVGEIEPNRIVVSFRSKETKILNVIDLVEALKKKFKDVEVEMVELSTTSFEERAIIMASAKVFISVVSDDMAAMAMLPKESSVVSIVPYGNKDKVWGPLAKHFGIKYSFWKNEDRNKAGFRPEILMGYNVNEKDVEMIINADGYSEEQNWAGEFYWSMVDTTVDVDAVVALVDKAMKSGSTPEKVEL